MYINRKKLLDYAPMKDMEKGKKKSNGVSYGLSEAGYDIRIRESLTFFNFFGLIKGVIFKDPRHKLPRVKLGSTFTLASAIEEFNMPNSIAGILHDKSTWARKGISVFNTVIEPGWKGFLTLEVVSHNTGIVRIKSGSGIGQVLFTRVQTPIEYRGKYQNQSVGVTKPKFEK